MKINVFWRLTLDLKTINSIAKSEQKLSKRKLRGIFADLRDSYSLSLFAHYHTNYILVEYGRRKPFRGPMAMVGSSPECAAPAAVYYSWPLNYMVLPLYCLPIKRFGFPSTVFWKKNGNGWVHNIESVTKLLKCNVFAQVIYQKIGNFLYLSFFLNEHPKFLIILEILTTKMARKHAQKVQKIAEPRGFRSRILHCSA